MVVGSPAPRRAIGTHRTPRRAPGDLSIDRLGRSRRTRRAVTDVARIRRLRRGESAVVVRVDAAMDGDAAVRAVRASCVVRRAYERVRSVRPVGSVGAVAHEARRAHLTGLKETVIVLVDARIDALAAL